MTPFFAEKHTFCLKSIFEWVIKVWKSIFFLCHRNVGKQCSAHSNIYFFTGGTLAEEMNEKSIADQPILPYFEDQHLFFWHPVGPHAGESLDNIIERKTADIKEYGFTLWAFAPARFERVQAWRHQLQGRSQKYSYVVCCGEATNDPFNGGSLTWVTQRSEDLSKWENIPSSRMTSYHRPANSTGIVASAFLVVGIEQPQPFPVKRPHQWFRANECRWEKEMTIPTRGEYLFQGIDTAERGPHVRLILTVASPYVVWVR